MAGSGKKRIGVHEFQAEVTKILHLMVHSVYSTGTFPARADFQRADALDKLRYEAIAQPSLWKIPAAQYVITTDKDC